MWILGIHFGHDSGAALIKDGEIIASALEERFVRVKHYCSLPFNAVRFCLGYANLKCEDIDYIAIPSLTINPNLELFLGLKKKLYHHFDHHISYKKIDIAKIKFIQIVRYLFYKPATAFPTYIEPFKFTTTKFTNIEHHESHAAAAYYTSGIKEECLVFTADGAGDVTTLSIWIGKNGEMKLLKRFGFDGSLGWFYGAVTEALGWLINDGEGKTMGLAPYGDSNKVKGKLYKICPVYKEGELYKGYNFSNPTVITYNNVDHWHFEEAHYVRELIKKYGAADVAAEAQRVFEEMLYGLIEFYIRKTGIRKICCAGGSFLNIKLNQKIATSNLVDGYWVFPLAGDGGLAIGAALRTFYLLTKTFPDKKLKSLYLGPEFKNEEIENILKLRNLKYQYYDNIEQITAQLLAEGKIVVWFQGRMEDGPRALGNRSILMDPRRAENKDILNNRVKFREPFRPYCPSILEDKIDDYLEDLKESEFMIISYNVKKNKKDLIPAVVHIDGTVRPQSVNKEVNSRYYNLIKEYYKITGIPLVLNTSLNIKGEPIVCSPRDAIKFFFDTGADYLIIGNFLVKK